MTKTSIIMDVDTGVDDAFAVLFAAMHPDINLLGITCVDGNRMLTKLLPRHSKFCTQQGAGRYPLLEARYDHY